MFIICIFDVCENVQQKKSKKEKETFNKREKSTK